jgi:hypothetical protein
LNGALLDDVNKNGIFYADRPQIVIYEPTTNGRVRLLGADYLVFADAWKAKHPEGPPQLMGQAFHLFESPNRFALPAFYTLHVWAWKDNPNGAFVNWHPNVSCQSFSPQPIKQRLPSDRNDSLFVPLAGPRSRAALTVPRGQL